MKRFAVLSVVVLGALASVTAAQAEATTTITNTSTDVTFGVFVPCANGGAGEVVTFTGTVHDVFRVTVNDNHFSETSHENFQGVTGTGLITGDTYVGNGSTTGHINDSLTNGQANETIVANEHFNGQGSAPNFTVSELEHITINADGTVTSSFSDFDATCG